MKRFVNLLTGDILFQKKYGFYLIYLFFTALYITFIYVLPQSWRVNATSVIIFSDPAILGLIFIGAIVLFEKSERVINSLSASPMRISEYVISKGISLAIISTFCGVVIALVAGKSTNWIIFLCGLFFGSCMFTFTGLAISTRIANFNQFIMYLIPITLLMAAPGVLYKFWIQSAWWMIHPGAAAYNLIDGTMGSEWMAIISLTIWLAITFIFAKNETQKMFRSLGGAKI